MTGVFVWSTTMVELTIRTQRRSYVWLPALSAAFVAIGVAMIRSGEAVVIGWLATTFFGLGIAIGLLQLARPGVLELHGEGFGFATLAGLRRGSYRWHETSEFFVWELRRAGLPINRSVAFHRLAQSGSYAPTLLPERFGMNTADLAALLNERRAIALGHAAGSS